MMTTQLQAAAERALEILPDLMDKLDRARGESGMSPERREVIEVCDLLVRALEAPTHPETSPLGHLAGRKLEPGEPSVRQVQAALTSTNGYGATWLRTLTSTTKDRRLALKFSSAEEAGRAQRTTVYRTQIALWGRFYRLKLV